MAGKPLNSTCNTHYEAVHKSGTRKLDEITLVVMHDTEGGTAESVARYFTEEASGGSAHLAVDDKECYRCLANNEVPWGAPGANQQGFHIEQCGFARWSPVIWLTHRSLLRRAAYKAAFHCVKFGIPPVFIQAGAVAAGKRGITTHAEVTKAYPALAAKYGSHSDPGPFWPRRTFMKFVRQYYAEISGIQV